MFALLLLSVSFIHLKWQLPTNVPATTHNVLILEHCAPATPPCWIVFVRAKRAPCMSDRTGASQVAHTEILPPGLVFFFHFYPEEHSVSSLKSLPHRKWLSSKLCNMVMLSGVYWTSLLSWLWFSACQISSLSLHCLRWEKELRGKIAEKFS